MNDNDSIYSDAATGIQTIFVPPGVFVFNPNQPTDQNLDQDLDGFDIQEDESDEEYFSTQEDMDDS